MRKCTLSTIRRGPCVESLTLLRCEPLFGAMLTDWLTRTAFPQLRNIDRTLTLRTANNSIRSATGTAQSYLKKIIECLEDEEQPTLGLPFVGARRSKNVPAQRALRSPPARTSELTNVTTYCLNTYFYTMDHTSNFCCSTLPTHSDA